MKTKCFWIIAGLIITCSVSAETLYDAVQHGMISNPDVLFNTARGLSARQAVDKAKGAYWPTVDVTGGFGREKSLNPTTEAIDGPGQRILNRTESNIEFKQNLFAGGGVAYELKRNVYLCEAQKLKTQGVAEDLALDVVNRYLLVLLHEKLYVYAIRNYQAHRSVFTMIKERSDAGISREAELDQADARLALAEANKISAEANLQEARINYAKVVGNWPGKLAWPKIPTRSELPQSLGQAIERGLDNHPTVRSTYADIKEAKSQYQVAQASYYPRVDLVLSASQNRNLDGLIGRNDDRLAMIRMNYNLFRGGADEAHVRETAYQVQEAYEVKNKALIDLKESIRLSWNAWMAAGLRLKPLRQHVVSSRQTRSAYQEQFKVGKRTLLDLLDSQNEFYQAQIELARGENDEVYSRYRILNGMGRLLSYLKLRLPANVVNNDVFSSAQTHILLNKEMDKIPYPNDVTDSQLVLDHPVKNMNTTPLTKATIYKNTTTPPIVAPKIWYVSAGYFAAKEKAIALTKHLRGLGFNACIVLVNDCFHVIVGPYEYRGHAGNAMERLKEVAHVPGRLVTYKRRPKAFF
ncbi:TolC family outer membrane protein [Legionella hackeliae]|uniref:Type I secretion outer membrane protein, TolC family n=1 Tax=Legionella hackeliae TaxID=449 RepID=A0A0A8UVP7_LEGHA|nr:TolC family outer membrane protein [Legionella hackeliae]KTD15487.1 agglutination protein [Legionella hackeliae]CEK11142.1 Type I secretion outer membrane protein, TolC family precursor [Legionella hackeliae]STX47900.1 agglutination protein [Legionella hackeliae]